MNIYLESFGIFFKIGAFTIGGGTYGKFIIKKH